MPSLERLYTINFENVVVSAVQDFFTLKAGATNGIIIRRISLSAGGVSAPAEMRLRLKRFPVMVTVGSGGTAPTVQKISSVLPFASLVANARVNDTSQATTSGTAQIMAAWQWNVLQDFLEVPPTEEGSWECALSEALIVDLAAAPASTVMSGFIVWEDTSGARSPWRSGSFSRQKRGTASGAARLLLISPLRAPIRRGFRPLPALR